MWFLVIVAGIVIVITSAVVAGWAPGAGHPTLGSFAGSIGLPALGASVFLALGLAHHDAAWTLAWVILTFAAAMMVTSVSVSLAQRAHDAGRQGLGTFTQTAGLPVSVMFMIVAWRLAVHHVDWTLVTLPLLGFAAVAARLALRRRRDKT